jgi:integrase
LRAEDVDLEAGVLRVERSRRAGATKPKKRAGRVVPILAPLRTHLAARMLVLQADHELLFGAGDEVFDQNAVERRAAKAWRKVELGPLELSDGRDTFAQLMIEAGVNARTLCGYLGHSSIETTFERYGHLMQPVLANAYLEHATAAEFRASLSGEFSD